MKTEAERTALKRAPDAKATERPKNPILRFLGELPGLVIMALVLAVLIKTFLFQAFYIPSASMEPTLHGCPGCSGDRVLVTKIPYYLGDPKRGHPGVGVGSPVTGAVDAQQAHAALGQQVGGERPGRREPGAGHPRKHDAGRPVAGSVLGEGQPPAVRQPP